ncbi:MAG: aminopeptidase [Sulfobacillus acidophilus]|uniref:Aminopeptidase n=1 Tax=Sulfobacillus acidophilus TaxID=53633 RepID=A0A2T2WGI0_9FIRM|nr:MAG: aminopeptidase [Sulfobacillus acidophilus]
MPHFHHNTPSGNPRARGLGIPLDGSPGPYNAITDVPGVEVGYCTLVRGDEVRTGVTAIHPRGAANPGDPVVAGFHNQNGNGEMTGVSWIQESGVFSGPIAITNTHAVGIGHAGILTWMQRRHPALTETWLLPVAAETWDGYLNDSNGHHVTEESVVEALDSARNGPLEEGSVGGGTGMTCYEFKAGSGTASRVVNYGGRDYAVGVFVQANFGSREELIIAGIPMGRLLDVENPMAKSSPMPSGSGSIIAIVATDAPLMPPQCQALARRVTLGLARTGTTGSHFSGDLFLAFSTANAGGVTVGAPVRSQALPPRYDSLTFIPWGYLNPFYAAVVQAVEEAVLNSLTASETMVGRDGHWVPGLPRREVQRLLQQWHSLSVRESDRRR